MPSIKGPTVSIKDLQNECIELKAKGKWEEASGKFFKLMAAAKGEKDDGLFLEAAVGFAECETRRGNYRLAVDTYMEALRTAERHGDALTKAAVLRGLGYVHWRKSDMGMALEYYNMVLDLLVDGKDQALLGKTYVDLGAAYVTIMDPDRAEYHFQKGIDILRKTKGNYPKFDLARAYNNLGSLKSQQGLYARGLENLERCIQISKETGDRTNMAWGMINAAESYTRMGNFEKPRKYLEEAQRFATDADDRVALMATYHIFGVLNHLEGHKEEAVEHFEKALTMGRAMDLPEETAMVMKDFGTFLCETGKRDEGLRMLKESLKVYTNAGSNKDKELKELIKKFGGKA